MLNDQSRAAFEAHMRRSNPCTRLARGPATGTYRTISVERAWNLWQAARVELIASMVPVARLSVLKTKINVHPTTNALALEGMNLELAVIPILDKP